MTQRGNPSRHAGTTTHCMAQCAKRRRVEE